jgi:hypothetical protein
MASTDYLVNLAPRSAFVFIVLIMDFHFDFVATVTISKEWIPISS